MSAPSLERRRIQVSSSSVSSGKLSTLARTHPFVQQVDAAFPSNERLKDALTNLETRYVRGKVRIADVLSRAIDGTLGDLLILTPTPDAVSDVWCLDPRGILTLSICKESYEDLGVAGHALPFKGHSDRYATQIPLRPNEEEGPASATKASVIAVLQKQKARFEQWEERRKVRAGLDGWDIAWCPLNSAGSGDSNAGLETELAGAQPRRVQPTSKELCSIHIPTNSTIFTPRPTLKRGKDARHSKGAADEASEDWNESLFEVLEWVGMALLGAQRLHANDPVNPFVAVYEPPTPSRVGDVTHLSWRGLLTPTFVQSIVDSVCSTLEAQHGDSTSAAVTIHGIPTSPVGYLPTSGGSVPARLPRESGEDTTTLLIGRDPSSKLGYTVVESIGQWDTRWG